eukprot:13956405-Alexandrium_andersonii.AAC.1
MSLVKVNEDLGQEEINHIEDIILQCKNIRVVEYITVPIGGGLSYAIKQRIAPATDAQVPGLSSLLGCLNSDYRRMDDDSCLNNNCCITKVY